MGTPGFEPGTAGFAIFPGFMSRGRHESPGARQDAATPRPLVISGCLGETELVAAPLWLCTVIIALYL